MQFVAVKAKMRWNTNGSSFFETRCTCLRPLNLLRYSSRMILFSHLRGLHNIGMTLWLLVLDLVLASPSVVLPSVAAWPWLRVEPVGFVNSPNKNNLNASSVRQFTTPFQIDLLPYTGRRLRSFDTFMHICCGVNQDPSVWHCCQTACNILWAALCLWMTIRALTVQ